MSPVTSERTPEPAPTRIDNGRGEPRWNTIDLGFGVVVAIVVAVRFLELRRGGAPPTIDAGNWLAFGDSILGHGVRSSTIIYPPTVPVLTTLAVAVGGMINGVAALGSIVSAAPALGVYWLVRHSTARFVALLSGLLVLGASSVGEAAAWGGFPQLLGLGLLPVALFMFDRLLTNWEMRPAITAGVALMAILATSHLIGLVSVFSAGVLLLARVSAGTWARPGVKRTVSVVGLFVLPMVWLVPLYVSLTSQIVGQPNQYRYLTQLTWGNVGNRVGFLFRDFPTLWWTLLVLVLATPVVLIGRRTSVLWRVTTSLLVGTAAVLLVTQEGRYLYAVTVLGGLTVGLWGEVLVERRCIGSGLRLSRATGVAVGAVVALQVVVGLAFFSGQRTFYGVLTPDLVRALDQVEQTTPPETILAVPTLGDAPVGWWAEAIARRNTLYASPLRWLVFDDELERARIANRIFDPLKTTEQMLQMAEDNGVDLVLLPDLWEGYNAAQIARLDPTVVEHPTDSVVLVWVGED